MTGSRYCRLSGRCVVLAMPILMCVMCAHTSLGETIRPLPSTTRSAYLRNAAASTAPAESQGDLLMASGDYVAAIAAYQRSSSPSAAVWNKIGVAYHHLFALEEARRNYQRALKLDPRYPDALNNLAAVYHGERNYKKAEKTYKKALKYGPNSAVAYRNLGTAYFSDGNYKEGANAYQKALALNPNSFDSDHTEVMEEKNSRRQRVAVDYCLAKAYALAGRDDKALIYLRRALDAGFNDRRLLMEDREFTRLRTSPDFQQLMTSQHQESK
jgi:tetratricopeptide (TPR) repeat protein